MHDVVCRVPEGALERLKEAERDLEAALEKERLADTALHDAKHETKRAEEKVIEVRHEVSRPRRFQIIVLYDGVKKLFEVRRQQTVKELLDQAICTFGPLPNPHTLSLYKDGKELQDIDSIEQAGIEICELVLLRPSTVKGGN